MGGDVWALIGTGAATLVLLIVPGLAFAWYALEYMIEDKRSYDSVIAKSSVSRPPPGTP